MAIALYTDEDVRTQSVSSMWTGLAIPSQSHESLASNCKNCAAPLNWHLEKCEYCETPFQLEAGGGSFVYNKDVIDGKDVDKGNFWVTFLNNGDLVANAISYLPKR